jgi:hypothetical protein
MFNIQQDLINYLNNLIILSFIIIILLFNICYWKS